MAKCSVINREKKRKTLVEKFSVKRKKLKEIIQDSSNTETIRYEARLKLQALPRNSNPTRRRNRCVLTGRGRGVFKKFCLTRMMLREIAMRGEIPGMTKASW